MAEFYNSFHTELKKYSNKVFNYSIRLENDKYYVFEIRSSDDVEPGDQVAVPFKMVTNQDVVKNLTKNIVFMLTKRYSEWLINIEGETKIPANRKPIK